MKRQLTVTDTDVASINRQFTRIAGITQNLSDAGVMAVSVLSGVAFFTPQLHPASVPANSTREQTFTVNGLVFGSVVLVNKPSIQNGLGIAGTRVAAQNQLGITFVNATAAPITPTAESYLVVTFSK